MGWKHRIFNTDKSEMQILGLWNLTYQTLFQLQWQRSSPKENVLKNALSLISFDKYMKAISQTPHSHLRDLWRGWHLARPPKGLEDGPKQRQLQKPSG